MGAWGITIRQSDDGLDLLDTIVAEQLRNVNFTVFNVSEAITLLNQTIQEEIEQYKQKPPSKITDFYISETLMHDFINAALLVAECLYDYYQTGELVVYDYIGENYDRRGISLSAKELFSSDALFFYRKTERGGGKMAGICLTLGKRREIERLYNDDMRPSEIAAAVGVTTATIYRELKRGETGELDKHFRPAYSAEAAERAVRLSIRNRGRRKSAK